MNVIVWGTNHNNTLGLVWSLGEVGHCVYLFLLKSKINYVDKSKYVKKCVYLTKYEVTSVICEIKKIASYASEKPVLFPTGDVEASMIFNNYDTFKKCCNVCGYLENDDTNLISKSTINEMSKKYGLCIPETWVIADPHVVPQSLSFPIFVKAENSVRGGKSIIHICENEDVLKSVLNNLDITFFPVLLQKYIQKQNEILILGCSLDKGSVIICPVGLNKIRQSSGYGATAFSNSFCCETTNYSDMLTKVEKMISDIGYTGLFSVEFMISNGMCYFLEVNFRNDGTSYLSTKCGCNLPDVFCKSLSIERIAPPHFSYSAHNYMNITLDFVNVVKRRLSFFSWIKDFRNTDCFSHFNKHDIRPFFFHLFSFAYSIIK